MRIDNKNNNYVIFKNTIKIINKYNDNNNKNCYENINDCYEFNKEIYNKYKKLDFIKVCKENELNYNYLIKKRCKNCDIYNKSEIEYNKNIFQKVLIKDEIIIKNINYIQKLLSSYVKSKNIKTASLSQEDIYKVIFYYYNQLV